MVGFLATVGVGVIFLSNSDSRYPLDHFLNHALKLGIPVEMVQFLLELLLKQISCCAPKFPFILTDKFHSLYVKESESLSGVRNFGKTEVKSGVRVGNSGSQSRELKNLERSDQSCSQIFYRQLHNAAEASW